MKRPLFAALIVYGWAASFGACQGAGSVSGAGSKTLPATPESAKSSKQEEDPMAPEEEFQLEIDPLPKGPVLPRFKRSTKEQAKIEERISEHSKKRELGKALPLIEKLLDQRKDDPYLLDDYVWTCIEVATCRPRLGKILARLQDYTRRYPKDVNRRITEMDLLDYLKKREDLYRVAKGFTMHHPSIAEGWIFLGEKQLESHKPNRAQLSLNQAESSTLRRESNGKRILELKRAIAQYEPISIEIEGSFMTPAEEKALERQQWLMQVRREFDWGGAEIDIGGGDDY